MSSSSDDTEALLSAHPRRLSDSVSSAEPPESDLSFFELTNPASRATLDEIDRFLNGLRLVDEGKKSGGVVSECMRMLDAAEERLRSDREALCDAPDVKRQLFKATLEPKEFSSPLRAKDPGAAILEKSENLPWSSASKSRSKSVGLENSSSRFAAEKLRRKHCEATIRKLQRKLLERAQKMAVAQRVDACKDEAVLKLRRACEDAAQRWRTAEREAETRSGESEASRARIEELKNEIDRKDERMKEMAKFAQETRQAMGEIAEDADRLKATIVENENRIGELRDSNIIIVQTNKQLSESLSVAENHLAKMTEENSKLIGIKNILEEELSDLKKEIFAMSQKIAEEKSHTLRAEKQKTELQSALDEASKKIKTLESEHENYKTSNQSQKAELKNFYQKQVDGIVCAKVSEFQNEMEHAKSVMQEEMRAKEKEIAFQFARHLHKVEQLHQYDLRIAEEKCKEKVQHYEVQLSKSQQAIQQLEENLTALKSKRGEIAAQLHNVMENQWHQALKIITNGDANFSKSSESKKTEDKDRKNHEFRMNGETEYRFVADELQSQRLLHSTQKDLENYVKILLQKDSDFPPSNRQPEYHDVEKSNFKRNSADFMCPTHEKVSENSDRPKRLQTEPTEKTSRVKPWK